MQDLNPFKDKKPQPTLNNLVSQPTPPFSSPNNTPLFQRNNTSPSNQINSTSPQYQNKVLYKDTSPISIPSTNNQYQRNTSNPLPSSNHFPTSNNNPTSNSLQNNSFNDLVNFKPSLGPSINLSSLSQQSSFINQSTTNNNFAPKIEKSNPISVQNPTFAFNNNTSSSFNTNSLFNSNNPSSFNANTLINNNTPSLFNNNTPLSFNNDTLSTLNKNTPPLMYTPSKNNKPNQTNDTWNLDLLSQNLSTLNNNSINSNNNQPIDIFDIEYLTNKSPVESNQIKLPNTSNNNPNDMNTTNTTTLKEPDTTDHHISNKYEVQDTRNDFNLAQLIEMGYPIELAQNALEITGNNLESAVSILQDETIRQSQSNSKNQSTLNKTTHKDILNMASQYGQSFFNSAKKAIVESSKKISKVVSDTLDNNVTSNTNNSGRDNNSHVSDTESDDPYSNESPIPKSPITQSPTLTRISTPKPPLVHEDNLLDISPQSIHTPQSTQSNNLLNISPNSNHVQNISSNHNDDLDSLDTFFSTPKQTTSNLKPVEFDQSNDTSFQSKELGNSSYRNGQYAEAVQHYTNSISTLSPTHRSLIPLLNNRSASFIKTGQNKEAIEDCTRSIELCKKFSIFGDDYIKALMRRCTAYQAIENSKFAEQDAREILVIDSCNKFALEFCSRLSNKNTILNNDLGSRKKGNDNCSRKFVNEKIVQEAVDIAISNLRAKQDEINLEEDERLRLNDLIEQRIFDWKKGKENNLRGLICSLDLVVWTEMNWKSVSLSEMIQPNQVKIKYIKAISRFHPDKLSPDCSIEQKMIANSVFSVLNLAWDEFKKQNQLN